MTNLTINSVPILDDYSETFSAQMVRVLITSVNREWAREAAWETKGIGRSATAPPCEATVECELTADQTPDGRPGFVVQMMDRKATTLERDLALRLRKGAFPYPKINVFDVLWPDLAESSISLAGSVVDKYGDGFQEHVYVDDFDREMIRIHKMDGLMHVQKEFAIRTAVTGGMFLILGESDGAALAAAEATLSAVDQVPNVIVKCASSGSKVGSKAYDDMVATTNDEYCPTLRERTDSRVPDGVECIYEIIVSGPAEKDVRAGMKVGIEAACEGRGVAGIHTANYGGKLGSGKIELHSLFEA